MNISVAIPETSLSDESLKAAKMRKASVIARACAIFGVKTIYVYGEKDRKDARSDSGLLTTALRYAETPQFLRKHIFPHMNDLKSAGVMLPLRIPSHAVPKSPKTGQVREGVVVIARGGRFVDVGIGRLLRYTGKVLPGRRITIRIKATEPGIAYTEVGRGQETGQYWGYAVKNRSSLQSLLLEWNGQIIITSRKGRQAVSAGRGSKSSDDSRILRDGSDLLVVFGSPERGVHEILGGRANAMSSARILDFFPGQQTVTVRLEEAITGALAIINTERCRLQHNSNHNNDDSPK